MRTACINAKNQHWAIQKLEMPSIRRTVEMEKVDLFDSLPLHLFYHTAFSIG